VRRRFAILLLLLGLPAALAAEPKASLRELADPRSAGMDPVVLRRIDAIINKAIARQVTPGAALAIGRHGQLVRLRGYGRTSYARGAPRVTEHTLYDLASLTKTVGTTSAVMLLVQEGLLDIDRPIADYLREWRGIGDRAGMTVRHLLRHTSGLPAGGPLSGVGGDRSRIPAFMAGVPLQSRPGQFYEYSDYGMILLGAIIERITGERLDNYLAHELLAPAGMLETTFSPLDFSTNAPFSAFRLTQATPTALRSRIAPTERTPRRGVILGVVHDPLAFRLDGVAGHAGMFSSAHDLALYCELLLDGGTINNRRIFDSDVVASFSSRPSERARFALGWELARKGGPSGDLFPPAAYGHTGFTGTSLWIDPVHDVFVVLLTNRVHPNVTESRHAQLRRDVHDAVQRAILDRPS
jgi:CubicO group peptidase (beta-lactamase class C family)